MRIQLIIVSNFIKLDKKIQPVIMNCAINSNRHTYYCHLPDKLATAFFATSSKSSAGVMASPLFLSSCLACPTFVPVQVVTEITQFESCVIKLPDYL